MFPHVSSQAHILFIQVPLYLGFVATCTALELVYMATINLNDCWSWIEEGINSCNTKRE
ncbi:hypothetical protein PAXRUDRAFT_294693 [Paxillus rubicundulus Ve08.2h10]|uniref:Uncharacterized protein n=1 Tax=Paxillus rubicundulus Ve08.2h10 TaxID=930991 RepID=A0A0D0DE72_9AGAM|nr:hypothetical protein PAXRUDRAFT_294693 [Paxillus rubicundulus Ve08.2h10]